MFVDKKRGGIIKKLRKRVQHIVAVLLGVTFLTFVLGRVASGDPILMYLDMGDEEPSQELIEETRHELGLDQPIIIQYIEWLKDVIRLDFGESYKTGKPVIDEIKIRLPATLELAFWVMIFTLTITVPIGVVSGFMKDKWLGKVIDTIVLGIMSLPSFCIGLFLIFLFSVELKWLPVMGRGTSKQLILPVVTMGLGIAGSMIRLIRSEIIEEREKEYVYAAMGLGMPYSKVILFNVFRNITIPIITRLGIILGGILGGSAIIETIFVWPGVGSLLVEAIGSRDYPMIQCYTLIIAIIYLCINQVVDYLCGVIDPRIRLEDKVYEE